MKLLIERKVFIIPIEEFKEKFGINDEEVTDIDMRKNDLIISTEKVHENEKKS